MHKDTIQRKNNEKRKMKHSKHDLPCWDIENGCGGRSCASVFPTPEPHVWCFKCEKGTWDKDIVDEWMSMQNNIIKLQDSKTDSTGNSLQLDRKGLFPQRGVVAGIEERRIRTEVTEKYGVEKLFNKEDTPYGYSFPSYDRDGNFVAQKIKQTKGKKQKWLGEHSKGMMFGMRSFPSGGKYITITEGEEDALACYQMLQDHYNKSFETPVISLKDGTGGAERDCKTHWEYLNSFQNIILCFDGDKVGRKAAEKVAKLFPSKVKIVHFPDTDSKEGENGETLWEWKDACDYLVNKKEKTFIDLWFKAEKYAPKGVLSFQSLWNDMTKEDDNICVPYPWEGLQNKLHGMRTGELVIVKAPPKIGKCFGKGTLIRMYDGSVKKVEEIVKGDLLMGDDSTPRLVQSTVKGTDILYKVNQNKAMSYVVNAGHILCLKNTDTKEEKTFTVEQWLSLPQRDRWKGYTKPINRQENLNLGKVLSPYYLGLWLGDGSTGAPQITTVSPEVIDYLKEYAKQTGLTLTNQQPIRYWLKDETKPKQNRLTQDLANLGVLHSKRIPKSVLITSRETRLDILAGLLDSDGYLNTTGNLYQNFEITQKSFNLASDILELAQSCGFRATLNETVKGWCYDGEKRKDVYYRVTLQGNLWEIPVKIKYKRAIDKTDNIRRRDPSVTGIDIEEYGKGDYYGFVLDGNHKFLLVDGTVVHNTQLMRELIYHLRSTTNYNAGAIFLEETKKRIGMGMCALHLNKPIQHPDTPYTLDELKEAHEYLSEENRIMIFDPQDERTVENIFQKIMYFAKAHDCKYIFLDHISMLAYKNEGFDERRFLDKLCADLKEATNSMDIGIIAVTHVNDDGKTRGSRAAVQLCDALIALDRDKLNADEIKSNTTHIIVEENRITGESGLATSLYYDSETGRMRELDLEMVMEKQLEENERNVKFDD